MDIKLLNRLIRAEHDGITGEFEVSFVPSIVTIEKGVVTGIRLNEKVLTQNPRMLKSDDNISKNAWWVPLNADGTEYK
jgi:hypothetical protein